MPKAMREPRLALVANADIKVLPTKATTCHLRANSTLEGNGGQLHILGMWLSPFISGFPQPLWGQFLDSVT